MAKQRRSHQENSSSQSGLSKSQTINKLQRKKQTDKKLWINKFPYILFFSILVALCAVGFIYYQRYIENRVRMPLTAPKVITKNGLEIPERYWGSYRPGVYFGLKTRSPHSLVTGLMWFSQNIKDNLKLRHWCNQWDGLKKYGWLQHDGLNFGEQDIVEDEYIITTTFVKRSVGEFGGDWTARITVKPQPSNSTVQFPISLLFYTALDGEGVIIPSLLSGNQLSAIQGETSDLGKFKISFESTSSLTKYHFLTATAPPGLHELKETVMQHFALFKSDKKSEPPTIGLIGHSQKQTGMGAETKINFIVHQITALPPYELEVLFQSASMPNQFNSLKGNIYTTEHKKHKDNFEAKFERVFQLSAKKFLKEEIQIAQAVMSNMIGSLGYFYGASMVQSQHNKEPIQYWEAPLFTAVPSRSFFPRGFLWDEGFHNLLISRWDAKISKEILGHWLDLMNVEGWIPREQILGLEAQSRVPAEFIVQKNTNGNPPTLLLALESIVRRMELGEVEEDLEFLRRVYPRLQAYFDWFNITQEGKLPGSYRWRGRDALTEKELNPKTLTSGLDDYPRASHPSHDERHIDLRCWMALAAKVLAFLGEKLGKPWHAFAATHKYLTDNELLDTLHWSPLSQTYSDFGLHTDKVKLVKPKIPPPAPGQSTPKVDKVRAVLEEPTLRFIDHFGYVSLFPFFLQIIRPENPKLGKILTDLRDPNLLWTNYGLRSLAKSSLFYMKYNTEHDPPYWRGSIWINMNYLAVRALNYYSKLPGPYQDQAQELYGELRKNLINNILKEFRRTGYLWENYNDKTGHGQGCHPFTGWSALVVLLMAELY
ncbi:mannosyl-oligosaccharide glucosidase-like [Limulus polyphemus]|uniref:Mannosyl-oligosaccharide glucosidase n=1 Tax=Limulus polyphemus TaxID=6850 RepID=A0ABM1B4B8_LIMPO|nr:mannosyl-oligosaccharide glucosidase-like [Limulus polyphemus]XP_022241665.1 mannosyl-oligosaccharide glucosidase-like [Limulus polyphemus]